jgi:DNA polymerase-1
MKKVLLLDGYNLLYRARSGFVGGEHAVVYNFFRSLRVLIENFSPDIAYFVLEGKPVERLKLFEGYKAQRVYNDDDGFHRQKDIINNLLRRRFPIHVVRHPNYECDDVLANLATDVHAKDECIVVSTDTDFLQLYDQHKNVSVYNPVRKTVVEKPTVNYVLWKALRGDPADNILGFKGVGDKRAQKLVDDEKLLEEFLSKKDRKETFLKNQMLIQFHELGAEMNKLERSSPEVDWAPVRAYFTQLGFKTIVEEKYWKKFTSTFDTLSM